MSGPVTTPRQLDVAALAGRVEGSALTPGDTDYDPARRPWNLTYDPRPAGVVVAESAQDVVAAVQAATSAGVGVCVQGTGHGPGPEPDGALMVRTNRLTSLSMDTGTGVMRIGAGNTWAPVLALAQQHGWAPLLGSSSGVGVAGYTLGGGLGWLARRYGMACDSVLALDLVTADGQLRHLDPGSDPDLWWAMRGAGAGSFGVVTELTIQTYAVTTVYAGNLIYPAGDAADVLHRFRQWSAELPEEMTSGVALINVPPLPDFPEPLRGRGIVAVRGAFCGDDLEQGRRLMDAWRRWKPPMMDLFGPLPFAQADAISMDPHDPMPARTTGGWADDLDPGLVRELIATAFPDHQTGPPLISVVEVRHCGGAVRRQADGTPHARARSGEYVLHIVGVPPTIEQDAALVSQLADARTRCAPHLTGAAHLNYLEGPDRRHHAPAGFYLGDLARLRGIKANVDPNAIFDFGFGFDDTQPLT